MADMTTIKGRIAETIYPNGTGAITAESHQALLLEMVDNINEVKQDVLVSGQNIRPLISGESLLGDNALAVLGTRFIYELENQKLFAMIDGALQDLDLWMANRAVHSQVAQVIEIQKEGLFQELVPLTIKNKAGLAALCWEYDGMIYEASMEDDVLAVVSKPKGEVFDKAGNYPLLHVGTADDLAGRGESVPASFGFRASGGKSIKDGRAYIKRIKGNSVVWNQKYKPVSNAIGTQTINGVTFTISEDGTVEAEGTAEGGSAFVSLFAYKTFIASHKYLLIAYGAPAGEWNKQGLYFVGMTGLNDASMVKSAGYKIFQPTADGESRLTITAWDGYSLSCKFRPIFIDLTQMFQAGNEPTTIEDFNARVATLGIDLNAYNEGQVIHCNTESIKSVGDNAWDEEWELGNGNSSTGNISNGNSVVSKNYIPIVGGEEYYISSPTHAYLYFYDSEKKHIAIGSFIKQNTKFIVPTNARYMRFQIDGTYGTTYNNDIMISLVHSGWKQDTDAGYQPYWQDTLPLPIIRKYFPDGMKSAGSAHDEIRFNKATQKWEYSKGKIKSVDLGSLTWDYYSSSNTSLFKAQFADIKIGTSNDVANMLCAPYTANNANTWQGDKTIVVTPFSGIQVWIHDEAYKDNLEAFRAAMAGVILYYEAAEWEWVELDAEDQNFRDYYNVADFGTEQSQSAVPSAAFSADIIYQFNAVDMIREHELEITELQSIIATMQTQLASLIAKS